MLKKLEEGLNEALERFRQEIIFQMETFDQTHDSDYLTRGDFEEINRQVFYCLFDFKNQIIEYLKAAQRQ